MWNLIAFLILGESSGLSLARPIDCVMAVTATLFKQFRRLIVLWFIQLVFMRLQGDGGNSLEWSLIHRLPALQWISQSRLAMVHESSVMP